MPKRTAVRYTRDKAARLSCPPDKTRVRLFLTDVGGLCIEAYATGGKKWAFLKKVKNSENKVYTQILGDFAALSLEEAKALASPLSLLCEQGINPRDKATQEAQAREKQAKIETLTFGELFLDYIEQKKSQWSANSLRDNKQSIANPTVKSPSGGPLHALATTPLAKLSREAVNAWIDSEEALDRQTTTNKARRHMFAALTWGLDQEKYEELIDQKLLNSKTIKARTNAKNTKNDDTLRANQLPSFFTAVSTISNPTSKSSQITPLLMGCRRDEVLGLKWAYLDSDSKSTKINCKVAGMVEEGKGRAIPLGDWLWDFINSLPKNGDFIFSSAASKNGQLRNPDKAFREAKAKHAVKVTIHGLRRTYSNMADELKIPSEVQHYLQGHAPQGVRQQNYKSWDIEVLRPYQKQMENFLLSKCPEGLL